MHARPCRCVGRERRHRQADRVLARLSLYGRGASRLHDEVLAVAAEWDPSDPSRRLRKLSAEKAARAMEDLETIDVDLAEEPYRIRRTFALQTDRVEPAGASYLRPEGGGVMQRLSQIRKRRQDGAILCDQLNSQLLGFGNETH